MKRHIIKQTSNAPYNPLMPSRMGAYAVEENVLEAVVVDVIVNSKHPQYAADGYNVGAVQFKTLKTDYYKDTSVLNWALPVESNISDYPLLNEIITVFPSLNRMYYSRKINASNRTTAQAFYGLSEELISTQQASTQLSTLQKSQANPPVIQTSPQEKLGAYFHDNQKIYRLEHDEGDIIYEGRSGQSIRMGASFLGGNTHFQASDVDQSPNILIRVGQNPNAMPTVTGIYGLVTEDINNDLSSLWMVADQIVNLMLATPKGQSIADYPDKLSGNQVFINTDRFIVNTKQDKIMGFSNNGIHWTSGADFTVDTVGNYISAIQEDVTISVQGDHKLTVQGDRTASIQGDDTNTVQGDMKIDVQGDTTIDSQGHIDIKSTDTTSILGQQVFIATENSESEPIPCGASLASYLAQLIQALLKSPIGFAAGPTGPEPVTLAPSVIAQLTQLLTIAQAGAAADWNSSVAFTTK